MDRECVQCGKIFTLSEYEVEFYKSKNLNIPKRCKECRELNKKRGTNATDPLLWRHQNSKSYINGTGCLFAMISALCIFMLCFVFISFILGNKVESSIVAVTIGILLLSLTALLLSLTVAIVLSTKKPSGNKRTRSAQYKATFYDTESLTEHYIKHGKETHSESVEEYLRKANNVIADTRCKISTDEDGDKQYFNPLTKEFVVVAKAGYIRTYYLKTNKY